MWCTPDVFVFRDYRAFLRAFYAQNKAGGYGFSLRAFSKRARLRSSNYLKLVMDGDRNLTAEMAARFAQACSLRGQAPTTSASWSRSTRPRARASASALRALLRFPRYRKVHHARSRAEAYHSRWYIPVVRELVARADFRKSRAGSRASCLPPISPRDAEHALAC